MLLSAQCLTLYSVNTITILDEKHLCTEPVNIFVCYSREIRFDGDEGCYSAHRQQIHRSRMRKDGDPAETEPSDFHEYAKNDLPENMSTITVTTSDLDGF